MIIKEGVVVAANYPLTEESLAQAITNTKCCIANKVSEQIEQAQALMPVCEELQKEIEILYSALWIMEDHVLGSTDCLTDNQVYEIIQKVKSICGCCFNA